MKWKFLFSTVIIASAISGTFLIPKVKKLYALPKAKKTCKHANSIKKASINSEYFLLNPPDRLIARL